MRDAKEMIKALEEFNKAKEEIVELWYKGADLNELDSIEKYPFHLSFDELNISDWVDSSIKELKKKI